MVRTETNRTSNMGPHMVLITYSWQLLDLSTSNTSHADKSAGSTIASKVSSIVSGELATGSLSTSPSAHGVVFPSSEDSKWSSTCSLSASSLVAGNPLMPLWTTLIQWMRTSFKLQMKEHTFLTWTTHLSSIRNQHAVSCWVTRHLM